MQISWRLMRVLGGRVFWSFTLVTFLMASLLASVNLASRFALKDYVDGQLERTPWDFTAFQTGGDDIRNPAIAEKIRSVAGVEAVEILAILRTRLLPEISETLVDGKPLQTPWLTLIAASDSTLLPPQLQKIVQEEGTAAGSSRRETRPILALVGPDRAMGEAFRALQGAREFTVNVKTPYTKNSIFSTPLEGVVRLDRDELSRWLMDQMGAPAYVPPIGAVLLMPYDPRSDTKALSDFDLLARGIVPADMMTSTAQTEDDLIHQQKAEYIPEIIYLARVNRDELISGWDIESSLMNLVNLKSDVLTALASARQASKDSFPNNPAPPLLAATGKGALKLHVQPVSYNHILPPVKASVQTDDSVSLQDITRALLSHGSGGRQNQFFQQVADMMGNFPPVKNAYRGDTYLDDGRRSGFIRVHEEGEPPDHHDNESISGYYVDSTTQVLLQQMQDMARLIGIVTLLIAIPLLWMGWMLATNLSGLLMLNERRKLGLMRLRGVPGKQLGRTLLAAVFSGGFLGGTAGILLGSVLLLLMYERGNLPIEILLQPQQVLFLVLFLVITVTLSLLVSYRLVRYATTISPLEASGRFASSEAAVTSVKFSILQMVALILGAVTLSSWVFDFSIADWFNSQGMKNAVVVLDFLALPLFLYGIITLLASRRSWIQVLMSPFQKVLGGRLGLLTRRHMAAKPHRSVAFLMIVALMASISLYPTIASKAFEDRAIRGAQVQIGSDWHFTFNSPDLASANSLRGPVKDQLAALEPELQKIMESTANIEGVESVNYMIEAFLPSFYVPGSGTRGVPLYLLDDAEMHKLNSYAESELGIDSPFREILERVEDGGVAVSPAVAEFWDPEVGKPMRLGTDSNKNTVSAPTAGILGHLPGMPARSVTNREGYVQSRVDYLNYLFDKAAYMVAGADSRYVQELEVFIPRTVLMVKVNDAVLSNPELANNLRRQLANTFPTTPLEMHTLPDEIKKVGSDMFVTLAIENMKIYIVGGIVLALIAIFAVALANYAEDRRTLSLLRIRGTSPKQLQRFLSSVLVSPAIIGLALGGLTALVAGFGLTNRVWEIRDIKSVVQMLKTHLVISELTVGIIALLLGLVIVAAWSISAWTFRKSATDLN